MFEGAGGVGVGGNEGGEWGCVHGGPVGCLRVGGRKGGRGGGCMYRGVEEKREGRGGRKGGMGWVYIRMGWTGWMYIYIRRGYIGCRWGIHLRKDGGEERRDVYNEGWRKRSKSDEEEPRIG